MREQSTLPSYVISNRAGRLLFVLPHDHDSKTQGLPCDGISPDCCAHIFGALKDKAPLYLAPPYSSHLIGNTRAGYRTWNMMWQAGGIVCRSLKPGPVTVIFLSWPWSWASCDSASYEKRVERRWANTTWFLGRSGTGIVGVKRRLMAEAENLPVVSWAWARDTYMNMSM